MAIFVCVFSSSIPSAINAIVAGGYCMLKTEYHYHNRGLQKIKDNRAKLKYQKAAASWREKRQQVSIVNHEDKIYC